MSSKGRYGEPLTYDERVRCAAIYDGEKRSCFVHYDNDDWISYLGWLSNPAQPKVRERLEQMKRMVACVNALDGIPHPARLAALLEACARAAEDCHAYDEFLRVRREGGQIVGTQPMNPNTRRRLGEISAPYKALMEDKTDD